MELANRNEGKRVRARHRKSRGGCFTCKARRVKCDEAKPICGACALRGESCDWPARSASQRQDTPDRLRAGVDRSCKDEAVEPIRDHSSNSIEGYNAFASPQPLQFNVQLSDPTLLHSLGGGYPHLNMIDLQMHSHYMLHTSKNMSLNVRRQHVWEKVIPRFATRNKAIMHLLLALAGLDLFSSTPTFAEEMRHNGQAHGVELHRSMSNTASDYQYASEDSPTAANRVMDIAYLPVVVEHHQRGLKALREELSQLSSDNINYAFAGSMLIVGFALASLHIRNLNNHHLPDSQPPRPRLDWIYLIQGLSTVVQQDWMEVRIGPLRDITHFVHANEDWRMYPPQSFIGIRPRDRTCPARISKFSNGAYEALTNLKTFHDSLQSDPDLLKNSASPTTLSRQNKALSTQKDALNILEEIYMRTLHVIRFSGYGSESPHGVLADLEDAATMAWPQALPREFLATLNESGMLSNISYVILAYFHLICSLLDCFWYIRGGFDEEIIKIKAAIEESGVEALIYLLKWPVSVICI